MTPPLWTRGRASFWGGHKPGEGQREAPAMSPLLTYQASGSRWEPLEATKGPAEERWCTHRVRLHRVGICPPSVGAAVSVNIAAILFAMIMA